MRVKLIILLVSTYLSGTASPNLRAQRGDLLPLPIEEAIQSASFPAWVPISLSPDGEWVAFTLHGPGKSAIPQGARYSRLTRSGAPSPLAGSDIWIANTRTGQSRNLTGGNGTSWAPVWSPDGRFLAFDSDRDGQSRLWLWEEPTDKLRQVSTEIVTTGDTFDGAQWTPDGKQVVIRVLPAGMKVDDLLDSAYGPSAQQNANPGASSAKVVESHESADSATQQPPASDSSTDFDILLSDLAVIDISSGHAKRIAHKLRLHSYSLSPDGCCVAVMSYSRQSSFHGQQPLSNLSIGYLETSEFTIAQSDIAWNFRPISWSPDSKQFVYSTTDATQKNDIFLVSLGQVHLRKVTPPPDFSLATSFCLAGCPWLWESQGQSLFSITKTALWKLTAATGKVTRVAEIPDHSFLSLLAARGGSGVWFRRSRGSATVLTRDDHTLRESFYEVDLNSGRFTELLEESRSHHLSHHAFDVSEDGKTAILIAEDAQHCQDVWMTGADTLRLRRITNTNPQFDGVELGASQLMSWRSLDGQELRGALLLPAGYRQGKRYPVIVYVYGGLRLSTQVNEWMTSIVINPQLLATRGYAILFPDAPQRLGTPVRDLAGAVFPAISKLIDLGIADPERLGIMGHSYGGYSTLALIEQSRQFRAAVDIAGTTNLMNSYAKSGAGGDTIGWVEEGQGDMGGSLWQHRERFVENSPLFYLDRIQTPVLLMHGGADTAVLPMESHIAFESLRRLGKEATYVEYGGEEHVPLQWSYANQVDYCERIIAWFDRYVRGGSANPSAMPSSSFDAR